MDEGLLTKSYQTSISLAPGAVYTFTVEARNSVGYSLPSAYLEILCAQVPDQIDPPITFTLLPGVITVQWDLPWNGGTTITSYTVEFRTNDGVHYQENTAICDGASATIINARECTIESSLFTESPYELEWGSSIYARI